VAQEILDPEIAHRLARRWRTLLPLGIDRRAAKERKKQSGCDQCESAHGSLLLLLPGWPAARLPREPQKGSGRQETPTLVVGQPQTRFSRSRPQTGSQVSGTGIGIPPRLPCVFYFCSFNLILRYY